MANKSKLIYLTNVGTKPIKLGPQTSDLQDVPSEHQVYDQAEYSSLMDIDNLIMHLETTDPDGWAMEVCATQDGKLCLLGQIYAYAGGDEKTEQANRVVDAFEEVWATTYMFFPVNDGKNPNYQQPTAKERCIAYLKDLRDGKTKSTSALMDEEYQRWKASEESLRVVTQMPKQCDGNCPEHVGEVRPVKVNNPGCTSWYFNYCDTAIAIDEASGLVVEELNL